MGIIEVKNLERTYPGKVPTHALRGVTLNVQEGEFVVVMGKSGSGKSTFLHQIALLDTPTKGEIIIDGKNVDHLDDEEKTHFRLTNIGYVFQEYAILNELTALENVALPSMVRGGEDADYIEKKATVLLEHVGLGHRLHYYPSELSGGEQQRVAIARALINAPKILLADEPCANLDTASSENVLRLLSQLNKEYRQTIVMISHEPEDKKWANRVIFLKDGLIDSIENIHGS